MSAERDRDTPDAPVSGDWRSAGFDVNALPEPYRNRILLSALRELDDAIRTVDVKTEQAIARWVQTFDHRASAMVHAAAEETGAVVATRVLRELGEQRKKRLAERVEHLEDRVGSLESDTTETRARASQAEIDAREARKTAEDTQRRPVVNIVNDIPTPPPSKESDAPPSVLRPLVSRSFYRRHKSAISVALLAVAFIALLVDRIVQAVRK